MKNTRTETDATLLMSDRRERERERELVKQTAIFEFLMNKQLMSRKTRMTFTEELIDELSLP